MRNVKLRASAILLIFIKNTKRRASAIFFIFMKNVKLRASAMLLIFIGDLKTRRCFVLKWQNEVINYRELRLIDSKV
jgi:hypothetical protein